MTKYIIYTAYYSAPNVIKFINRRVRFVLSFLVFLKTRFAQT